MFSFPLFTCVSVPYPATRRWAALPWPQFGLPAVSVCPRELIGQRGTMDLPARAATQESFTASGEFICLQGRDAEEGAAGKRHTSSMCSKVNIHNTCCCLSASSLRYHGVGGGGVTGRSVWDSVQDHFHFFEKCLSSALLNQRFYLILTCWNSKVDLLQWFSWLFPRTRSLNKSTRSERAPCERSPQDKGSSFSQITS